MNDLIRLIYSLNDDDVAAFLAFAKARNQRTDVKNIKLFQLLQKGARRDLDIKIYGKPNKNALHALLNRLKESLIEFIAIQGFSNESEEEMQIFKLLLAARIFLEQGQFSLGFKTLHKARSKAQSLDLYAVLQEIYQTHIPYIHLDPKNDLEDIVNAYQNNEQLYLKESKMVMAYATVQKALKAHPPNIFEEVKKQMDRFDISIDQNLSFKSLYQLMNVATEAATLKSDYAGVSIFMNHVYNIVENKKHLANKHLYYHLEIIYLMAGTCFRNRDFTRSQELLGKLYVEMQKQKGKFKSQFQERYQLLKALNLNYTGEAQKALKELDDIKKPSLSTQLAHIMVLFQQEKWNLARKTMKELYHSDSFYEKKEGFLWVVQKNILEILIYIELQQPDLVESRMKSFIKRFKIRLEQINEQRVVSFMKLLQFYFDKPYEITNDEFLTKVEQSFEWKTASQEDIFVMSFYAFLKARMENTSIYEATLKLVNNAHN
ncbi:hypothetical protein [Nonlabens sp.]|uniref:hypothetical protein n=1 Tax=Nonlabens sp. TaxID=1888209 RepID=UPI003F6A48BF